MGDLLVFQSDKEIERLRVQHELLHFYEKPILDSLFSNGENLSVLDIGCNDGEKTVSIFSYDSISNVIGLEYNVSLAKKASEEFGNNKFYFASLDVECDGFPAVLEKIMEAKAIKAFDCIYLSFVLMHIKDARKILNILRDFLKENGTIVIVEANDSASFLSGDKDNLLGTFLDILAKDKYSGNRILGGKIETIIKESGYKDINIWCDSISAGSGELKKKEDIITVFFSYLSEDIELLLQEEDNEDYRKWKDWLVRYWPELEALILKDESVISMGMKILTCKKG